jgi:hypothetical protein
MKHRLRRVLVLGLVARSCHGGGRGDRGRVVGWLGGGAFEPGRLVRDAGRDRIDRAAGGGVGVAATQWRRGWDIDAGGG